MQLLFHRNWTWLGIGLYMMICCITHMLNHLKLMQKRERRNFEKGICNLRGISQKSGCWEMVGWINIWRLCSYHTFTTRPERTIVEAIETGKSIETLEILYGTIAITTISKSEHTKGVPHYLISSSCMSQQKGNFKKLGTTYGLHKELS